MKRKVLTVLTLMLALCLMLTLPALAESNRPPAEVVDGARLLTSREKEALCEKLEDIGHEYDTEIAIVTLSTIGNGDIDDYVNVYYDTYDLGYGASRDGILLLLVMDIREFRILSNGAAADVLTPGRIDAITDDITPDLSNGDYADAFALFADRCEYYLEGHINGFPFHGMKVLLISLIVGLAVGLIVVFCLKAQLKSVRMQHRAHDYVKAGSMHLTQRSDLYLYRTVKRIRKESSGSRSSGSRNVGGGRF